MTIYQIRMASGETFTAQLDLSTAAWIMTGVGFVTLSSGTVLNAAQIESLTPCG